MSALSWDGPAQPSWPGQLRPCSLVSSDPPGRVRPGQQDPLPQGPLVSWLLAGHSHPGVAQRSDTGAGAALGGPQNSVPSEKVPGPDLCARLWKSGPCRPSEAGTEDSSGQD